MALHSVELGRLDHGLSGSVGGFSYLICCIWVAPKNGGGAFVAFGSLAFRAQKKYGRFTDTNGFTPLHVTGCNFVHNMICDAIAK